MDNNKRNTAFAHIIGSKFNFNRLNDVQDMKELSQEERDIKIRQEIKDLKL
ncbi:MAG: hypothetical protein LBD03_07160 [Methanobrevibacter sp.]|jgi:hypothetical protein|nr:hypothetical protein [Candidatus Methanovirga procula]